MKKHMYIKMLAVLLTVSALACLSGCGKKDPAYLSGIKAADYVDVADYSQIAVEAAAPEVTEDYLNLYVQYMLSMDTSLQEITDRDTVESGDVANIDYEGKKDGVAFDGGTAQGYDLTIGSGSFIAGFEDGLIGKKVGESVTLDLTFPEDYGNEELAGQDVTFDVTINRISENVTPELTDDYVKGKDLENVETVEDYRNYLRDQLMAQAEDTYNSEVQNQIIQYLLDNSTFKQDPPTEMTDRMVASYTDTFTSYATQYGLDLPTFMSYYGYEDYEQEIKNMALDSAKQYIIMKAIADKEDLNISDRAFNTALSTEAAQYGYKSVEDFKKEQDAEAYREYLMMEQVLEFLQGKAVVSEPTADTADAAADTDAAAADTAEDSDVAADDAADTQAEEGTAADEDEAEADADKTDDAEAGEAVEEKAEADVEPLELTLDKDKEKAKAADDAAEDTAEDKEEESGKDQDKDSKADSSKN